MEKTPKNSKIYICEQCDFKCCKNNEWTRHISTAKHQNLHKLNVLEQKNSILEQKKTPYICKKCGKLYKARNSLWYHNKKCINDYDEIDNEFGEKEKEKEKGQKSACNIDSQMLLEVLKQNQEFQMFMLEQHKQVVEMAMSANTINTNCNNTNNNNTFNLQLFLNEKCKDALNINEFVDTIKMQLSDLENFAHVGYAEGVSKICVKNLNILDTFKRPIHCSDAKRETLYIKNNNEWIKETEDRELLKDAIKKIANKNIRQINEWIKENPNCTDPRSKDNNKYLKIVMNSMSGTTIEEQQDNIDKIVKNVTKAVTIDKYAIKS
jgi:hypothetical protein